MSAKEALVQFLEMCVFALGAFLIVAGLGAGLAFGAWIIGKVCRQW